MFLQHITRKRSAVALLALLTAALTIGWTPQAVPGIAGSAGAKSSAGRESSFAHTHRDAFRIAGSARVKGRAGRESALTAPLNDTSLIAGSAGAKSRAARESS